MERLGGDKVGSELQRMPEGTHSILTCTDDDSLEVLAVTMKEILEVYARLVVAEVSANVVPPHKIS